MALDHRKKEYICKSCGLVIDKGRIDRGPDWRSFSEDDGSQKRVGSPVTNTRHDKGLSTQIGWQNRDANGNTLSSTQKRKMGRLRKWDNRFQTEDSKDRNLKNALGEISRMASALGLSEQIRETASVIYRQCLDQNLLPGRSIEGVATASLYIACRQCNSPRSLEEFYPVSRIVDGESPGDPGVKEFTRTYKYISKELGLKMEPVKPEKYINRFVNRIDPENKEDIANVAKHLISLAREENLHSGKSPTSIAAGAIYSAGLILDNNITQREVADAANASQVTVRNRYKEVAQIYDNLSEAEKKIIKTSPPSAVDI